MAALRVAVAVATAAAAAATGGWACDVCTDVASTFRRQFPGLGVRSLNEPALWGGSSDGGGDGMSPATPGCTAFAPGSSTRAACIRQRLELTKDARLRYHVWASLANAKPAYDLCAELGKCDRLPPADAGGALAATTDGARATLQCYAAVRTWHCTLDPNCDAARLHCSDTCTACAWLMRSWPQFTATCAPPAVAPAGAGATATPSSGGAPPRRAGFRDTQVEDAPLGSVLDDAAAAEEPVLLEAAATPPAKAPPATASKTSSSSSSSSAAAAPALTESGWRAAAVPAIIPRGLGSPPLEMSAVVVGGTGGPDAETVQGACMSLWAAVASLPEAWFQLTAEDSRLLYPWDPLTTCRCLGRCPYNSIDALAVADACGAAFDGGAPELASRRMLAALLREPAATDDAGDASGRDSGTGGPRSVPRPPLDPDAHM